MPNYPATGHVRHFETADAVQQRYEDTFEDLRVSMLIMNSSGRAIYIMDGKTAAAPGSGSSTVNARFAEIRH